MKRTPHHNRFQALGNWIRSQGVWFPVLRGRALLAAADATSAPRRRRTGWRALLRRREALAVGGLLVLLVAMAAGYWLTLRSFHVEVDGRTLTLRTHLSTVGEALAEARIWLQPEDRVEPPGPTPLANGMDVRIQRARTVYIDVDGEAMEHRTLATTVGEALSEAGIKWIPEDQITMGGQVVPGEQPLYAEPIATRRTSSRGGRAPSLSAAPPAVHVTVKRAVPIGVQDNQTPYTFLTTAGTLGEALLEKGITLYAADRVEPPLDTPITAGLQATIDRSCPVTLLADGHVRQTRTRAATVADLLEEEGIKLGEMDYTRPQASDAVAAGMRVVVVRVGQKEVVEQESIPFELQYRGNPNLEIDQQQLEAPGANGVLKRSLQVRYENGIEVSRSLAREWVETPPQNRIISFGTKIVLRQISTPNGNLTYWRKLRVLVTAYTAATCGKTRDDPTYGITRIGWKARKGVIAIDPNVMPFLTEIYVPGYGTGIAADTGSAIKGLHIDLAYDEWNFQNWYRWEDVYLLGSPPPAGKIRWILPGYPTER